MPDAVAQSLGDDRDAARGHAAAGAVGADDDRRARCGETAGQRRQPDDAAGQQLLLCPHHERRDDRVLPRALVRGRQGLEQALGVRRGDELEPLRRRAAVDHGVQGRADRVRVEDQHVRCLRHAEQVAAVDGQRVGIALEQVDRQARHVGVSPRGTQ